jgi:hypothetical protein
MAVEKVISESGWPERRASASGGIVTDEDIAKIVQQVEPNPLFGQAPVNPFWRCEAQTLLQWPQH